MKRLTISLLVAWFVMWILPGCHKDTSNPGTTTFIPPRNNKEIINSNLEWRYDANKEVLSAKVMDLEDVGNLYSAGRIVAVYLFLAGSFIELSHGNPGNSNKFYYESERRSLMLHMKFHMNVRNSFDLASAIGAAIANAREVASLNLPEKAKVIFQ